MIRQKELLSQLRVSRQTLWRWRRLGLPCYKVDKTLFFDEKEVLRWIERHGDDNHAVE